MIEVVLLVGIALWLALSAIASNLGRIAKVLEEAEKRCQLRN